ncbi:MAG TPA: HAD family hydrolase [Dongiaceae bacterium]|nr:HAD family hydrolase [Dongiaceae bacterium]
MNGYASTIALVFDFDDTLTPDSTSALLERHGVDTRRFWAKDARALIARGYDPSLAYLRLLLDRIGPGKPFGEMTNRGLRKFGGTLALYPGLPELVTDLRRSVKKYKNIDIEFYIVSGGLREVILGNSFIRKTFSGVYGCELAGDAEGGVLRYVSRCVTFTEKTRFLFEINKGLDPNTTRANPYQVNKDVPQEKRAVPWKNMIYVGDGLTDIPCFSLLKHFEGTCFGVFNPGEQAKAKRALVEFLIPRRVISVHAPKYGPHDELGALIRAAIQTRCSKIKLERQEAGRSA